ATTVRRATLPDATEAIPFCGHAPGGGNLAGAFLWICRLILTGASDGQAPGGARGRRAISPVRLRSARALTPGSPGGRPTHSLNERLLCPPEPQCGRGDSNPQGRSPTDSKSAAYATSATPALRLRFCWRVGPLTTGAGMA